MTTTILKEQIVAGVANHIRLPKPFVIVHIGFQGDDPTVVTVWALCDPERPSMPRTLKPFATGQEIPADLCWEYVGTAQAHDVPLVWHVFERRPE